MSPTIRLAALLLGLSAFACSDLQTHEVPDGSTPADASDVPDAGHDETDAGDEPDAGEETPDAGEETPDAGDDTPDAGEETPDAGEEPVEVLRFVVIGDTGTGSDKQFQVADAIKNKCDADGCDFVMMLGDNIYDEGVTSLDDPQWQTKFEQPYANIDLPFYAVLGNHDYGGIPIFGGQGGMGGQFERGPIEVAYTQISTKWKMPATHYTMKHANACFMMLDTNAIFWDFVHGKDDETGVPEQDLDQKEWYPRALAAMQPCDWVFVAGHHCYTSNGKHGNAGKYEGIDLPSLGDWAFFDGRHIKTFVDNVVKDSADVILAGHDHNRQWLVPNPILGSEMIVSGAGAKTTPDEKRGNPTLWENFDTPGFLWVQIEGKRMTGQFYDMNGTFEFERVVTKP